MAIAEAEAKTCHARNCTWPGSTREFVAGLSVISETRHAIFAARVLGRPAQAVEDREQKHGERRAHERSNQKAQRKKRRGAVEKHRSVNA